MAETVRYVVRFTGHVQGVGFRATSYAVAQDLDVHGFVRNEPDASVKMDVEGTQRTLKELVARIEAAMIGRIDATQIDERPPLGRGDGFRIQY